MCEQGSQATNSFAEGSGSTCFSWARFVGIPPDFYGENLEEAPHSSKKES